MPEWTLTTPPHYFPSAVATIEGWTDPVTGEVLVAIANLVVKGGGGGGTTFMMDFGQSSNSGLVIII